MIDLIPESERGEFYELCHQYANGFITSAEFHAGLAALETEIEEIGNEGLDFYGLA